MLSITELVTGKATIHIQACDFRDQALPIILSSPGAAMQLCQGRKEALALNESYQVMRTEFLEYSIVLILINFSLVINPMMNEVIKTSKKEHL